MKTIAIASDHAGFEYKEFLKIKLGDFYKFKDFGTYSEESVDYPDYAHLAASAVENGECDCGILICGSGNGVQITANKHQNIRCGLCWQIELAKLARQHNDCNMIAIPARFVSQQLALEMVETFINTDFEGGRHQKRVKKIKC